MKLRLNRISQVKVCSSDGPRTAVLLVAAVLAVLVVTAAASARWLAMALALSFFCVFFFIRKKTAKPSGAGIRAVSSITLPGGARVHEIVWGNRAILVGHAGGALCVLDSQNGLKKEETYDGLDS